MKVMIERKSKELVENAHVNWREISNYWLDARITNDLY